MADVKLTLWYNFTVEIVLIVDMLHCLVPIY